MATIPLFRLSIYPPAAAAAANLRHLTPTRHHLSLKTQTLKAQHKTLTTKCSFSATTPISHRLISAATYFLPLLNGLHYSRFLFAQFPSLSTLFRPLIPLISVYRSIPYASFVTFFGVYLGIVRNRSMFGDYVRFNAMQALVVDLVLSLPMLVMSVVEPGRGSGLGYKLMVLGFDVVFVGLLATVVYCWLCCVLGRTPFLPFVADAASRQV